jgi:hypothetical protein
VEYSADGRGKARVCDLETTEGAESTGNHPDASFRGKGNIMKNILLLEAILVFRKEPVQIMEEHAVEDGALGTTGTMDSCHNKRHKSRNGPTSI